jgi:hypothetical protein
MSNPGSPEQRPPSDMPSPTSLDLVDRMIYRRAVEAVVWGMPAVNYDLMLQAFVRDARGGPNRIAFWSGFPSWKNQTLTPNPDTIYVLPFFDTRSGPMVLEIPPADGGSITGSVDDCWQTALEDVGAFGVDEGRGGKYLIIPPGYDDEIPDGYIRMPSDNYQGFAILRSILRSGSDADLAQAVDYARRIRLYPLSDAADPPAQTFVDAIDLVFDATIPYDMRFFWSLDRIVQAEPWLERDRAMIDVLKSLGIEKGKPFDPDARTQAILAGAAAEARDWLDGQYESVFTPPFFENTHWALPASHEVIAGLESHFAKPGSYPVDGRGMTYSMAFFSPKHSGRGSYYLMSTRDRDGQPLRGAGAYNLHVPARVPASQYWSATAYDRGTHALIREMPWASRSSNTPGLQTNADGSVDLWIGPQAPPGGPTNWVPTSTLGDFEILFRFYGPQPALFEKSWTLPDIERRAVH